MLYININALNFRKRKVQGFLAVTNTGNCNNNYLLHRDVVSGNNSKYYNFNSQTTMIVFMYFSTEPVVSLSLTHDFKLKTFIVSTYCKRTPNIVSYKIYGYGWYVHQQ